MSLTEDIARVLLETTEIDLIDFYLGAGQRKHIDGAGIREVGRAISDGRVAVFADDSKLRKHADGTYRPRPNELILSEGHVFADTAENRATSHIEVGGFIGTADQVGLVIHEAVHALLDMKERAVLKLSNEVAAYVAQVTFLHHYVGFWDVLGEGASTAQRRILVTAFELARDEGILDGRGVHLRWDACRPLRHALKASPIYSNIGWLEREWDNDGIPDTGAGAKGVEASSS